MNISYECSKLIEELKNDIAEFGNIEMYGFFKNINGNMILINYDFIEEDLPLKAKEIEEQIVQIMKASEILKILEEQNSFI